MDVAIFKFVKFVMIIEEGSSQTSRTRGAQSRDFMHVRTHSDDAALQMQNLAADRSADFMQHTRKALSIIAF